MGKLYDMQGIDTTSITINKAHILHDHGVVAVGKYLRANRTSPKEILGLHSVGIKVFSIGEQGNPTHKGYFTAAQALIDAEKWVNFALSIGQPIGSTISPAIDYDSNPEDVKNYIKIVHDHMKGRGFLNLPYGNGVTLRWAVDAGYAVGGFLAQSTGFAGFKEFKASPDCWIIQGASKTEFGMGVDLDNVQTVRCLW